MSIEKRIIRTEEAPAAVGPYAQAVASGGQVYTSGQLPIDPHRDTMPDGMTEQTRQCLNNVKAILEASGSSMDRIIKTTVFLQDMARFSEMNEVYASFFADGHVPARSAVEVSRLPKDALIMIDVIAALGV